MIQDVKYFPNVLAQNLAANGQTAAIEVANLSNVSLQVLFDALANYNVTFIGSDQLLPPDITKPIAQGNKYSDILYIDSANAGSYNKTTPFNPHTAGVSDCKIFTANVAGLVWLFIKISSYAAGKVLEADITGFSNN